MTLRIATRGSRLALAQARDVARRLAAVGADPEIVVISTAGDRTTDRAFSEVGAFGIFVRDIEVALLEGRADLAVHSYKDLPSQDTPGLSVVAVPERVDPADVLLIRQDAYEPLEAVLPLGVRARVGTSALRRQALLRDARPDLSLGLLRGNVPTRIRALGTRQFDAVVLAAAGIDRLERDAGSAGPVLPQDTIRVRLDPRVFVPAPSQGAIAVQVRSADADVRQIVIQIDDPQLSRTLQAERIALGLAEAGCTLPFGAWCETLSDGTLRLHAALGTDAGVARAVSFGTDPMEVARAAWRDLTSAVNA